MVFEKEKTGRTMVIEGIKENHVNTIDNGPTMEGSTRKEGNSGDNINKFDDKYDPTINKLDGKDDKNMIVTLSPMEIRAFIMEVTCQ